MAAYLSYFRCELSPNETMVVLPVPDFAFSARPRVTPTDLYTTEDVRNFSGNDRESSDKSGNHTRWKLPNRNVLS